MMKLNIEKKEGLVFLVLGLFIFIFNVVFLRHLEQISSILNLVAGVVGVGGPLVLYYRRIQKYRKIEDRLPDFLNDLKQNIKSGMTLPKALKKVKENEYGVLDPYVKEMAAKIDWGISFEKILKSFSKKVPTTIVKRTVATVVEAHRSGGNIVTVLESVVQSTQQIENIKKERSAEIYTQLINGYIIFFVFLGVMFGLAEFLFPAFKVGISETKGFDEMISQFLFYLILIQGFFAGLSIGKLSEGTFIAGLKHSLVLLTVGYAVYIFFI